MAVSGLWFEQLTPGLRVQHATTRTVTETDNVLFTTMTMNPQPLHLDAEFAAGSPNIGAARRCSTGVRLNRKGSPWCRCVPASGCVSGSEKRRKFR